MTGSSLELTSYHPNLKSKKVLKRIERVMVVCAKMVRLEAEQPFMATDLRKLFGNYSMKNTLASWLFSNLMEQTLWYEVGGQPYSYRVDPEGFNKIMRLLEEAKSEAEN
jgi:hypothetical protein